MARKWFIVLILMLLAVPAVLLCFGLLTYPYPQKAELKVAGVAEIEVPERTVTAEVTFRAFDGSTPLSGVLILLIGPDGEIVDRLTTDEDGGAAKSITVDPKYLRQDPEGDLGLRGTVTALAFKEGYRETVLFEVPVSAGSAAQPFFMEPLVSGERNEPVVGLGNNHHLEVLSLVKKYAEKAEIFREDRPDLP
ncbi:MAG TPA: hypothetical protein GX507_08720 [Clostridia bacterium]|nr:hypothetical protein [Clostridia bacterium]